MILCNNLIYKICHYLDIKTLCMLMLYLPALKFNIGKSYCLTNNIFNCGYNITNYANTLLYFQNNYIYKCYHCGHNLLNKYYLIICPCVINALGTDLVYTKYHIDCLHELKELNGDLVYKESENNKVKIIKCQFCNTNRMCFMCNLYS